MDHYYTIEIKRSDQHFFRPCAGTVKTEKEALKIVDSLRGFGDSDEKLIYRISEVTRKTKKIIKPE